MITENSTLLISAVESESLSTVHVNSDACLYCSGRTRSDPKLNALNRIRPSKKNYYFFIFNCVLFEKLVFNIIQ